MTQSAIAPYLPSLGGTRIIMINIMSLVESDASDVTLRVKPQDLVDFADFLIRRYKAEVCPAIVNAAKETLISKKEVMEKFGVCPATLWNWERAKTLIPVRIGRKVSYRQADVEQLILKRGL